MNKKHSYSSQSYYINSNIIRWVVVCFSSNSQFEKPLPVLLDAWLCTNATTKAEMNRNNKYLPLLLIWLAQMCYLEKRDFGGGKNYCQIKKFSLFFSILYTIFVSIYI